MKGGRERISREAVFGSNCTTVGRIGVLLIVEPAHIQTPQNFPARRKRRRSLRSD